MTFLVTNSFLCEMDVVERVPKYILDDAVYQRQIRGF
jgi:hypothetical protein